MQVLEKFALDNSTPTKKKISKLMLVEVTWRKPVAGNMHFRLIIGHLHNDLARKSIKSPDLIMFWDTLATFCAGGMGGQGRIIGMDANMSVSGVQAALAARGVGLTLLCHHYELANPEDSTDDRLKWDTLGLWLVGPVDIAKCR